MWCNLIIVIFRTILYTNTIIIHVCGFLDYLPLTNHAYIIFSMKQQHCKY